MMIIIGMFHVGYEQKQKEQRYYYYYYENVHTAL